ncbi:uncharacterized protein LOC120269415 [Dioscorea cayenensis subsp. rotundata]|uniref:Uncharacterized protein LOC120269415 n=1 Tax=Dioscorea cayennensis subsp. rotundata TaxID=55577 RepID=A0AB40C047_DIOCR|nr:uncharacterized protein LOC120269415 [Dioscorea cayenensis subsp. rotundata]
MGERLNPEKGRQELEEIYSGIIDDSADLTFKDLASFQQNGVAERKNAMTPIREDKEILSKSPSLDFSKGFEGTREHLQHIEDEMNYRISARNSVNKTKPLMVVVENSPMHRPFDELGVRRRPGIPHSNICAMCDTYIYIFRHRCLVCGRVYCRECVLTGMGDMHEGRKCIECLGRRFSERYIHKAGEMGCYCWKYPNNVRSQELKWAEKGPRRGRERRPERSGMASRPMSPMMTPGGMPGTPSMSYMSRTRSPTVGTPLRSPCHNVGMSPYNVKRSSDFPSSPYAFPL